MSVLDLRRTCKTWYMVAASKMSLIITIEYSLRGRLSTEQNWHKSKLYKNECFNINLVPGNRAYYIWITFLCIEVFVLVDVHTFQFSLHPSYLTLSWRRYLSYRNQSTEESNRELRHERFKAFASVRNNVFWILQSTLSVSCING